MNSALPELNVLVLAVGGNVSQGILKALAASSFGCRVIGADINELQMGLYTVDAGYIAPHAADPFFIEWLVDLCLKERVHVILTGCEPILRVLTLHKDAIEERTQALCLVCDANTWTVCDDKLLTCQWLQEHDFAFPRYAASENMDDLHALAHDCGYPLIAKPRIGGGAKGVFLVEDAEDLKYASRKSNHVIQEFLGDDRQEYTVGCFCDRTGEPVGSIVMWRELLAGTTYRAVVGDFPEIRETAEAITRELRPMGPCNLQLRLTKQGPVCFEINPRFSGTTPIRAAFGFNEVDASLRHFLMGEAPISLPHVTEGVALRYWNELYVTPEACAKTREQGFTTRPEGDSVRIEPYGME